MLRDRNGRRWAAARRLGLLFAALVAWGSAASRASAQSRDGLTVDRFLGSWELVEWISVTPAGETTYPYGEGAEGQISYTGDGRMSAHLMRPPADPGDAPPQHLAYWGRFTLDVGAGTITHHVIGADRPGWIGSDQVRRFRFEGRDRLILS
ncbi:MAG TPA: lipocalin-like domain-containing protein, partial [Longimicrobiales bacterium]|nr:lipocalin-like domain-containing protein [Longimicrobiales bacterium]